MSEGFQKPNNNDMTTSPGHVREGCTDDDPVATPSSPIPPNAADEDVTEAASDDDDAVSTTSTEDFEHEPFETFQTKVSALCYDLWPDVDPEAFQISRIGGGSFNRIIGITFHTYKRDFDLYQRMLQMLNLIGFKLEIKQPTSQEFVIRIPRIEHAWVDHEVALIRFLNLHTMVPVPVIEHFDLTKNNKIGERYTIQRLIQGKPVVEAYEEMSMGQRATFAHDLGHALAEMSRISFNCPGTLDPDSVSQDSCSIKILRLQCPPRNAAALRPSTEDPVPSHPQSVLEFLQTQFKRQLEFDRSRNRLAFPPWPRLEEIVVSMDKMGLFEDSNYYLTHMDLEPRNILVSTIDENTAKLSAILDWDEAIIAPRFMNCRPPSWMWDFGDDEELDESKANDTPPDPELQKIKRAFEEAVGPTFLRYAYTPEYRIARSICRVAITCINTSDDFNTIDEAIEDWNELHPDLAVKPVRYFDSEDEEDNESKDESDDDSDDENHTDDKEEELIDSNAENEDEPAENILRVR